LSCSSQYLHAIVWFDPSVRGEFARTPTTYAQVIKRLSGKYEDCHTLQMIQR
jgi:hypothetical protein